MNKLKCKNILYSVDAMTTKYQFETEDGYTTEIAHINRPEKHIICFSTQIGCYLGCRFCAAPKFIRNLSLRELLASTIEFRNFIISSTDKKKVLFSAMGVGEPTLNRNFRRLLNFGRMDMAFSTAVPNVASFEDTIRNIKNKHLVKIQLSVHAIGLEKRERVFGPTASALENLSRAVTFALNLGFEREQIEVNYALMEGVNDTEQDAKLLAYNFGFFPIKLNGLNIVAHSPFTPSTNTANFRKWLLSLGVHSVEEYQTDGVDIAAACGMFLSGLGE